MADKKKKQARRARLMEQAVVALLREPTIALAATSVGISEATLHRWLKMAVFQNAYRAARRNILEAAVAKLQQASTSAAEALERQLKCDKPEVVVRAATVILDQATRGSGLLDIEGRLQALESRKARQKAADDRMHKSEQAEPSHDTNLLPGDDRNEAVPAGEGDGEEGAFEEDELPGADVRDEFLRGLAGLGVGPTEED